MSEHIDAAPLFDKGGLPGYGDYLSLLGQDLAEPDDTVDYIIVPQGRPAEHIDKAAALAAACGATLVSLCSHDAQANAVADTLADMPNGPRQWLVADIPPGYRIPGIKLAAQQQIPEIARKPASWNLSEKRNVGLLVGRMTGSASIFFCDDDLQIRPEALCSTAQMLFKRQIAGLRAGGFPDKSMIMHAAAAVNDFHSSSKFRSYKHDLRAGQLSANSLAVNPLLVDEHFPLGIYNEDWLFAYESIRRGLASLSDKKYIQDAYDPFQAERARQEEFGENVIDGLYGDLKQRRAGTNVAGQLDNKAYWQAIIEIRRCQYEYLITSVGAQRNGKYWNYGLIDMAQWQGVTMTLDEQQQLRLPLQAGLEVNQGLDGAMLLDYLRSWQDDGRRWRRMLKRLPRQATVKEALGRLGLDDYLSSD